MKPTRRVRVGSFAVYIPSPHLWYVTVLHLISFVLSLCFDGFCCCSPAIMDGFDVTNKRTLWSNLNTDLTKSRSHPFWHQLYKARHNLRCSTIVLITFMTSVSFFNFKQSSIISSSSRDLATLLHTSGAYPAARRYSQKKTAKTKIHSSGAAWESRWTSWAVRPNKPAGFRGRKAILNHASALVSACP